MLLLCVCVPLGCRDLRRRGLLGPFVHLHLASDACYIRYVGGNTGALLRYFK
jgi:hypothetical protein